MIARNCVVLTALPPFLSLKGRGGAFWSMNQYFFVLDWSELVLGFVVMSEVSADAILSVLPMQLACARGFISPKTLSLLYRGVWRNFGVLLCLLSLV
jgi:hypothetical protein